MASAAASTASCRSRAPARAHSRRATRKASRRGRPALSHPAAAGPTRSVSAASRELKASPSSGLHGSAPAPARSRGGRRGAHARRRPGSRRPRRAPRRGPGRPARATARGAGPRRSHGRRRPPRAPGPDRPRGARRRRGSRRSRAHAPILLDIPGSRHDATATYPSDKHRGYSGNPGHHRRFHERHRAPPAATRRARLTRLAPVRPRSVE